MLSTELEVCIECGNLHLEGIPAPRIVGEFAVCDGPMTTVDFDDLVVL